jgi:hypothetical protein
MTERTVTGDCTSCESTYEVVYEEELTSEDLPEYCPFCGEVIETLSEDEYIEDDELNDDEKWD